MGINPEFLGNSALGSHYKDLTMPTPTEFLYLLKTSSFLIFKMSSIVFTCPHWSNICRGKCEININ